MRVLFMLVLAYLVGSIPVGYLLARLRGIIDIRKHGSGSMGATNVSRVLGWRYFILVFLLDSLKAMAVMALCVTYFSYSLVMVAVALALLVGNGFPLFLGFRGGKGIATTVGIIAIIQPVVLVLLMPFWLVAFILTDVVGLASCVALGLLPIAMYIASYNYQDGLLGLCMTIMAIYFHRANLQRLFEK